jgi:membrane-associated protease RseP (regulator of RpoE activity)
MSGKTTSVPSAGRHRLAQVIYPPLACEWRVVRCGVAVRSAGMARAVFHPAKNGALEFASSTAWIATERPMSSPNSYSTPSPAENQPAQPPRYTPSLLWPTLLFLATCLSTYSVGGLAFFLSLMTILTAHELGHFFQAKRYGVPASYPYFIPMPFSPIGTMGAVIAMHPGMGDRRTLFDIGITGPLAGLVPAIAFSVWGLQLSEVDRVPANAISLGEPLLFRLLGYLTFGPLPEGHDILLHPMAYAGWVGIFITGLNLIPIGQLDGGHVLYALLVRRAYPVAVTMLLAAGVGVFVMGYWGWILMILLLFLIGPIHPPTANDEVPLGVGRALLGWTMLLFPIVGFTPTPFLV